MSHSSARKKLHPDFTYFEILDHISQSICLRIYSGFFKGFLDNSSNNNRSITLSESIRYGQKLAHRNIIDKLRAGNARSGVKFLSVYICGQKQTDTF